MSGMEIKFIVFWMFFANVFIGMISIVEKDMTIRVALALSLIFFLLLVMAMFVIVPMFMWWVG